MSKPKVYVTRRLPSPGVELLQEVCDVEINPDDSPPSRDLLTRKVQDMDGLLCLLTDRINSDLLSSTHRLKVVSSMSVGFDHIDIESATRKGIYVTFTPGVLTEATADFTWALLMSVTRRVVEADHYLRTGKWKIQWNPTQFLGVEFSGKTLGIVGMGRIGKAIAQRSKGFKMRVIYFNRTRIDREQERLLDIEYVPLNTLLGESDFVTIHVPLSKETWHMIDEDQLKQMKRTSYLVNTSRGPVINQTSLTRALQEGWIAGAGLDVFEKEPIDGSDPLTGLDNVVLTPHIASATKEARSKMAEVAAKNLISVLRGEPPQYLVNKNVLNVKPLSSVKMIE